jgi:hypothetical protein
MNLTTHHPAKPGASSESRREAGESRREAGDSHSEQVRQRRAQQTSRRVSGAANRATGQEQPRPTRPVTVRNATFGTPVRSRVATTNPRRQFYVTLDSPGAELRLPALPRVRFGPRLLSGIIALACLVSIFTMLFSSLFIIGVPVVKGLQRLTQADIEAALDIASYNAVEVDVNELRAALLNKYDILESVSISIALPNQVTVRVKERSPLFAWQTNEETRWADEKGFPKSRGGRHRGQGIR